MTALKAKGKAAVKIGMQYRKLVTDSRFYKPPNWKRETSFRVLASAVRESAVCLHRSFATYKWVDEFLNGTNLLIDRGVTRLDGARDKKQVWRPHVRTWGLSEEKALYWRKCLWHCWDFLAPPKRFGARGIALLLAPSLRPCWFNHNAACKKVQMYTLANNFAAMWQKFTERAQLAQRIMTYCNYVIVQLLTSNTWRTQKNIDLLLGA